MNVAVERSSLLHWYPVLGWRPEILAPRTELFVLPELPEEGDGPHPLEAHLDAIRGVAARIGYPLFLRTDQLSAKHGFASTCYVPTESFLFEHVLLLLEEHDLALWMDGPSAEARALVFREFLPLRHHFRAFAGLPIARERRVFVRNGHAVGYLPYWPAEAIKLPTSASWREELAELDQEDPGQREHLEQIARLVYNRLEERDVREGVAPHRFWSVDFAQHRDGRWFLIDMAVGERSWGREVCS